MGVPTFSWEIAFGNLPGDDPYTWPADISLDVAANTFTRGKSSDLDQIQAGTGSLTLYDSDGDYDPRHSGSPWYPNVKPRVPIRQTATLDGITYPLCLLYVQSWPRTRQAGLVLRNLTMVDALAILGQAGVAGLAIAQGTTDTHVTAVLDYIGWPAGKRSIGTGSATIAAQDFAATDTTTALAYLQAVASNEAGLLYADGAGAIVFLGRGDLLGPPFNDIQAHFTDDPTDTGAFVYIDSVPTFGDDRIFNDWTGTRPNGTTAQQAIDPTSVGEYGDLAKNVQTLLVNDSDLLATMQTYLAYYKEPRERLAQITVAPNEDSAYWHAVLPLDIGSRVSVAETMLYGDKRTDDYLIEAIECPGGPGSDAGREITYKLWPTDIPGIPSGLVFDSATLGLLNTATLGF